MSGNSGNPRTWVFPKGAPIHKLLPTAALRLKEKLKREYYKSLLAVDMLYAREFVTLPRSQKVVMKYTCTTCHHSFMGFESHPAERVPKLTEHLKICDFFYYLEVLEEHNITTVSLLSSSIFNNKLENNEKS